MLSQTTLQLLAASLAFTPFAAARDVPAIVRNFYNTVKGQGQCPNKLASGFYAKDNGPGNFAYCQDPKTNVLYLQGTGGALADMDIDCDGRQGGPADDGRCGKSDDTQSITSFADTVRGYKKGISDLDAKIHPYVVFGNAGDKSGFKTFDPQKHGVKPLSVMAVVCGDKLIYGIWGDENGVDGSKSMVGEASISLATACYGKSINGNNGHDQTDVLYIAFPGSEAVPGADGAAWGASNYDAFEKSIRAKGDQLIQRLAGGAGGGSPTTTAGQPKPTCTWIGHCPGDKCSNENDCDQDWVCKNGKCSA
ncbi:glycoside hydrolase family 75 protein [Apiospora rasikravindrae]|uniref:Endo-chitosanase n=1 Tax=Apiospora rasikravindrae TaxID=990691 RepID=A0ABR1U8G4_9PEZI